MQLDRLLQSQGFGSRKECRQLIRNGWLTINGERIEDPFLEVEPAGFRFEVDDEPWEFREKAYLMLNKPEGYECSREPMFNKGVFTLLPDPLVERGVQPVGRLDSDTTGLLLLSDDGQFIHALTAPKRKVAKTYRVTLKHAADTTLVQKLLDGVWLNDETEATRAVSAELVAPTVLHLAISEGKYHQVKRMVAAAGNRVEALRRVAVGGLALPDDLAEGAWRWLSADELALLRREE